MYFVCKIDNNKTREIYSTVLTDVDVEEGLT